MKMICVPTLHVNDDDLQLESMVIETSADNAYLVDTFICRVDMFYVSETKYNGKPLVCVWVSGETFLTPIPLEKFVELVANL